MINMLRKGIKFSIQRVYFPQSYFESRHYGKRFNSIGKFKSLTFTRDILSHIRGRYVCICPFLNSLRLSS